MKITESQLRQVIREAINEFRSDNKDGDRRYVTPGGDTNVGTGLDYLTYRTGNRGKTQSANDDGKLFQHTSGPTVFSHGKGVICSRVADAVEDMFFGNKNIEWTDAEKEEIDKIRAAILHLATITKEEGNKKRGYVPDAAEE